MGGHRVNATPPRNDHFISIGDLLTRRWDGGSTSISTATLATAIEQQGVYGWDSYGRFIHLKADGAGDNAFHFREALKAVALEAEHEWASQLEQFPEQSPAEQGTGHGTIFDRYGWGATEIPDFRTIAQSIPASPRRAAQAIRMDNATLTLIGVMHALMVEGKQRGPLEIDTDLPPYSTQTDLIGAIVDVAETNNLKGVSRSTVEGKFVEAKRVLNAQAG